MNCKICNTEAKFFVKGPIFPERMEISYYRCPNCGFIQTEEPHWLDKAYSDVIAKTDIGLVSRNIQYANLLEKILLNFAPDLNSGLDYGGGYGMFTRLMRDKGFDFYWHDDYCENVFANGFQGDLEKKYDVITAFEVMEHLPNPHEVLRKLAHNSKCFFFSTSLQNIDKPDEFLKWWYRAEYSGQHISFYSERSMHEIAKIYKRNYYYIESQSIHILSDFTLDQDAIVKMVDERPGLIKRILKDAFGKKPAPRKSLLTEDHEFLLRQYLKKK